VTMSGLLGGNAGSSAFVGAYLCPCVAALTRALRKDTAWKPLHQGLLMHTRDSRARVRRAAISAVEQLYTAGGDEALVLLPEALPFLSETQHDAEPDVESATHELISTLQAASGEDLSRYLS
jgi:U3 small nucleolar RNA-associated protein 10